MIIRGIVIGSVAAMASLGGAAQACNDHASGKEPRKASAARESAWVAGEVRDVDLDEGTITLAHDKIDAVRMKPMSSMLIKAANVSIIEGTKPGDKVRFRVRLVNDQPVLTRLSPLK